MGVRSERAVAESLHCIVFWSCDNPTLGASPIAAMATGGVLAQLRRARMIACEYDGVMDGPTVVACAVGRVASCGVVAPVDAPDAAAMSAAELALSSPAQGANAAADEPVPAAEDAAGSDPVGAASDPRPAAVDLGVAARRPCYKLVVHVRGLDAEGAVWLAGGRRGLRRAAADSASNAVGSRLAAELDGLGGADVDVELYNLDIDPTGVNNLADGAPSATARAAARELWRDVRQLGGPVRAPVWRHAPAVVLVADRASAALVASSLALGAALLLRVLFILVARIV